MTRLISFVSLTVLLPFLMAASCRKNQKTAKCPADVMCTKIFASVGVAVKNTDGTPGQLDEVYTIRVSTSEILKYDQQQGGGMYTILDDSYRRELQLREEEFRFVGKKGGKTVVEEPYVLTADCCHVAKKSGAGETVIRPQ